MLVKEENNTDNQFRTWSAECNNGQPDCKVRNFILFCRDDAPSTSKFANNGIFTKNLPFRELKIKTDYQGCIAVAEIPYNEELYTFVSLYAILENGYSITTLHRMFSDLTPILDGKMDSWGKRRKVILGGDFNASLQWDEQQPGESHKIMFDRLENFGMVDLIREKYNQPVQTWRRKNAKRKWQLDYVFASQNITDRIKEVNVLYDQ